jgi:sugar/nucleoside kinase (ribokinase family)
MHVWIAGSVNMDIVATAARHPKIGETVVGREVFFFPGGKGANQAVAAARLGAPTALIGKVGDDAFGRELRRFLAAQNVDLKFLRETAEAHTGTAVITVADADNSIVVVPGANGLLSIPDVAEPALATGDVALSQFEIPLPTVIPPAPRPSSIRRLPRRSTAACSTSWTSSFSTRPSLARSQAPRLARAIPTLTLSKPHAHCRGETARALW